MILIAYYDFRGYCEPIKAMLEYLNIPYQLKFYTKDPPDYSDPKWRHDDRHNLGIDFANLPYFIDGDVKVAESWAVMRHIARENKDLYPVYDEEHRMCDAAQGAIQDLRGAVVGVR